MIMIAGFLNINTWTAGKRAFIAGVADDNGYGWAIAKSLAAAGAEILVGTWVPVCIIVWLFGLYISIQLSVYDFFLSPVTS